MKLTKDPKWLPWSVLALGCVGGALRFLLYRVAVDEKGLLIPMHPVELILWALTAASVCLASRANCEAGGRRQVRSDFHYRYQS